MYCVVELITVMQSSSGSMIRPQQRWSDCCTSAWWTKFLQGVLGPWVAKWFCPGPWKLGITAMRGRWVIRRGGRSLVAHADAKKTFYKVASMQVRRRKFLCCRCYSCAGCLISGKTAGIVLVICRQLMNFAWWMSDFSHLTVWFMHPCHAKLCFYQTWSRLVHINYILQYIWLVKCHFIIFVAY
jgi:hypothetical protein